MPAPDPIHLKSQSRRPSNPEPSSIKGKGGGRRPEPVTTGSYRKPRDRNRRHLHHAVGRAAEDDVRVEGRERSSPVAVDPCVGE